MIIQVLLCAKCSMNDKEKSALGLLIESVMKPDARIRGCAYNQGCYDELMELRKKMIDYLYSYEKYSKSGNTFLPKP